MKHHDQHIHVITSLCTNIVFCIACFSCKLYIQFYFLFFLLWKSILPQKNDGLCFKGFSSYILVPFDIFLVVQSLSLSVFPFLPSIFFSIYFRRFLHYFCPHRTQKYLFATFVFETILSACLQFSFYFFLETCFAFSLQNRFAPFQI